MLVDGVTKLTKMSFNSQEEEQAENYRKMIVAMATDIRVILIKLADRLHNMRTLCYLGKQKQIQKAKETLEIYAPLAHRLGIDSIKWQLEDLAFATLHPRKYAEIQLWVSQRRADREDYVDEAAELPERRARQGRHHGRDHRPRQALLLHLRQDEPARQGVQRDLRPHGPARAGRDASRTATAPGHHPLPLEAGAGALQGLHRHAQVQHVPVAAHDRHRPGRQAARDPDPHLRHAPDGRVRRRGALAVQGEGRPARRQARLAAPDDGVAVGDRRSARVHGDAAHRPVRGRGLRLHAQGRREEPGGRLHADRLRLRRPHRRRQPLRGRQGQRPHRASASQAAARATSSRSSPASRAAVLRATGSASWSRRAPAEDAPVLPPRAARGFGALGPRPAAGDAAPRGPAGAEDPQRQGLPAIVKEVGFPRPRTSTPPSARGAWRCARSSTRCCGARAR